MEILRDARGVPHIRAQSLGDALFAQGYVTAQDRLWQMDLSRRNAEGELSEVLGNRTLRMDIESRTLGFPQVAASALADLSPDERSLLSAYTRGVNAFIDSHRDRLPLEFLIVRYQPKPWRDFDSVAVALNLATALSQSWESDLMREHVAAKLGQDLSPDVFPDHSALDVPVAEVPPSTPTLAKTNSADLSLDVLGSGDDPRSKVADPFFQPGFGNSQLSMAGVGSNNWVVNGSHTKSGKPLLANDPHLGHSVPSVWYMIHLKAPGLNVIGSQPSRPPSRT